MQGDSIWLAMLKDSAKLQPAIEQYMDQKDADRHYEELIERRRKLLEEL